jgi:hypothetical protein
MRLLLSVPRLLGQRYLPKARGHRADRREAHSFPLAISGMREIGIAIETVIGIEIGTESESERGIGIGIGIESRSRPERRLEWGAQEEERRNLSRFIGVVVYKAGRG